MWGVGGGGGGGGGLNVGRGGHFEYGTSSFRRRNHKSGNEKIKPNQAQLSKKKQEDILHFLIVSSYETRLIRQLKS